ncbi:MAG: hypothetical protein ABIL58_22135 [Pseudomonadota bacterium]
MIDEKLSVRLCRFAVAVCCVLLFSNVLLPALTRSCDRLERMAAALEDSGIDPSRYYYTDVPAVGEAIHAIDNSLRFAPTAKRPTPR